jgi:hypothetical protein
MTQTRNKSQLYSKYGHKYPYATDAIAYYIYGDKSDDNMLIRAIKGAYGKGSKIDEYEISSYIFDYEYSWEEHIGDIDEYVRSLRTNDGNKLEDYFMRSKSHVSENKMKRTLTKSMLKKLIREELKKSIANKKVKSFVKGINKEKFFKLIGGVDIVGGVAIPKEGDSSIYFAIGQMISQDDNFSVWYDGLPEDKQYDVDALINDELNKQFKLEW